MKQHPKRKDLERLTISIPSHINEWIRNEAKNSDESLSIIVTRALETYLEIQQKFSKKNDFF